MNYGPTPDDLAVSNRAYRREPGTPSSWRGARDVRGVAVAGRAPGVAAADRRATGRAGQEGEAGEEQRFDAGDEPR